LHDKSPGSAGAFLFARNIPDVIARLDRAIQ
jgi:hypothetical protein